MIRRTALILCALLPLCLGLTLDDLTRCPYAPAPLPVAIRSDTCGSSSRCQVSASSPIHFEIQTVAPYDSEYVFPNLVVVTGIDEEGNDEIIPVELPEYLGCENLANGCPIASGDSLTWTLNWQWEPTVVTVGDAHTVKFTFYDSNETQIACFKMDVDIVA